ncbi:MAG: carboxypeptidase-like regulatory domain-containing protein, partial [Prevotella sp.]|nr:carboxypeptidase-like regulatory domain-containing protein [Prevotella sp.]
MANQFILNSVLALSLASSTQAWAGNAGMGKHAAHVATAQQQAVHTVTGQVTDEKGEPLIGVSILIKGTSKGTVTDIDGNFKLPVDNKNAVLVFSYIGYTAQEVNVQGRPSF